MPPKVSVLMAVYNGQAYVREAIDSILDQTFTDFEFLIVDDGSTDETTAILETYSDSRIKRLRNAKNIGLTKSLNIGLNEACGEFVARMDADDASLPTRLEMQLECLESDLDLGVVGSEMDVIGDRGVRVGGFGGPLVHGMIVWRLLFERPLAHPTVMMRRSAVTAVGGYNEEFTVAQDYELWTRLIFVTRFANLPEVLVRYRTHPGAVSRQRSREQTENVLRARQVFLTRILGKPVSLPVLRCLQQLKASGGPISNLQARQAVSLLMQSYRKMEQLELIKPGECEEVLSDMVDRIIQAGSASSARDQEAFRPFQRDRWYRPAVLRGRVGKAARVLRGYMDGVQRKVRIDPNRGDRAGLNASAVSVRELPRVQQTPSDIGDNRERPARGLSLVVLTYNRPAALRSMLEHLIKQDLSGIDLELILWNNSSRHVLRRSVVTKTGRLLARFDNIKVINSSDNWESRARYGIATVAANDVVMFLDDDVLLLDRQFVQYMYRTFLGLRDVDILSCWNRLWVDWSDQHLDSVGVQFSEPTAAELTETDTVGSGISMFNKRILLSPRVMQEVTYPRVATAYDLALPLIAALELGSRSYYLPSYGMLQFHRQWKKGAMMTRPGRNESRLRLHKLLLADGYIPVLAREEYPKEPHRVYAKRLARTLPVVRQAW